MEQKDLSETLYKLRLYSKVNIQLYTVISLSHLNTSMITHFTTSDISYLGFIFVFKIIVKADMNHQMKNCGLINFDAHPSKVEINSFLLRV